ncbi:hypothetical protein GXP71_11865 [Cellulomonas sp. H30R-01]|jgi:hypothetical protein|uniref:hypothetical protein n=1 Tax=Cellulomonas sp. H30R-01 TaxID=2704467 RepID=UPI00138CDDC4|nr:hypothetical protein [Cellulomonas sp. H30R-01]QHT56704.1 hypothetical protein GXP71_11865 [Cellulomonas sp. H30R-01]
MLLYTELVVVAPDVAHPEAEAFWPAVWESEDFDSDGDFYYDGIDGRWTTLELRTKVAGSAPSVLEVYTFRERRLYGTGLESVARLERTLDDVKAGRWADNPAVAAMTEVAVTSLAVQTTSTEHYRAYLEAVEMFLAHAGGTTVGRFELDAAAFHERFLRATDD